MIYLETGSTDPCYNLAFEEYIFEKKYCNEPYFMLWQNNNAIIIGKYQNTIEEINCKFIDEHRIKVVRRNSGGGAVYHDMGNLNFSFIVEPQRSEFLDFSFFIKPIINTLGKMGIHAEFTGRNDITINGKKISGNSQYIKNGRVLHHGTILFSSNLDIIQNALSRGKKSISSKSTKSTPSIVANLIEYADKKISLQDFKKILKQEIFDGNKTKTEELTEEDICAIDALRKNKYDSWEWNFGHSLEFNLKKERRFQYGNICAYIIAVKGKIAKLTFKGDFFTYKDISALEKDMIEAPLGCGLREWLIAVKADKYIKGISADDLYELILY